jgi:hypothetical protein
MIYVEENNFDDGECVGSPLIERLDSPIKSLPIKSALKKPLSKFTSSKNRENFKTAIYNGMSLQTKLVQVSINKPPPTKQE